MVTRDFQKQSLLGIFVSYFRPHMGLFLLDMACALMISLIDLAFPFVSRTCMNVLIPESRSQAFFAVIAVMLCAYVLRAGLQYVVCYWGTPSACWWRPTSARICSATSRHSPDRKSVV